MAQGTKNTLAQEAYDAGVKATDEFARSSRSEPPTHFMTDRPVSLTTLLGGDANNEEDVATVNKEWVRGAIDRARTITLAEFWGLEGD